MVLVWCLILGGRRFSPNGIAGAEASSPTDVDQRMPTLYYVEKIQYDAVLESKLTICEISISSVR